MKKIFSLILCVVVMLVLNSCETKKDGIITTNKVTTPYVDLIVPESFINNIKISVESEKPYIISFSTLNEEQLFTIYFDKESENVLGTLMLDNKNIVLYAKFANLDTQNANYKILCEYQEGMNTITKYLSENNNFVVNEIVDDKKTSAKVNEDVATFDIETPIVTLKYPSKWKEKITVDIADDGAKFYNDKTHLFDIMFTECDGCLIGTYKDTPIYIIDYKNNNEEQATMQEDVNVILQNLEKDSNFISVN